MKSIYFLFALLVFTVLASAAVYPVAYAEVCTDGCYNVTDEVQTQEGFCDEGTCAYVGDGWFLFFYFDVEQCRNPTVIFTAMEVPADDTFYFYGWDTEGLEHYIAFRSFGEELSTAYIAYTGHMPDPEAGYSGFTWYLNEGRDGAIGLVDYIALRCSSDRGGGGEELRELSVSYSGLGCPGNHLVVYAKRDSVSVSNVEITIYDSKGNVVAKSSTQAGGVAYFIVNEAGAYKIEGRKSGYEDATASMYIEKLCPQITPTSEQPSGGAQPPIVPDSGTGQSGTLSGEGSAPQQTGSGLAAFSNNNEPNSNEEIEEVEEENNSSGQLPILPLLLLFAGAFALLYIAFRSKNKTRTR